MDRTENRIRQVYCTVVALVFLLLHSPPLSAQAPFSAKYYRDQARLRVVLPDRVDFRVALDGTVQLTETEVIELALENNLDVNVERHGPLSALWAAEERKAVYDPLTTFALNWDRETTPATSVLQGGESLTNVATSMSYGYRQQFSTGTMVESRFIGARNRSTSFFYSFVPALHTRFEVFLRQSLLQGRARIAPDYEIEISRNNLSLTEQEFRRKLTETIVAVQDRYWELHFAQLDMEAKRKSLELAEIVLEQNRIRMEAGTAAELEVVHAEAEVALRKEELVRSEFNRRSIQDQLVRLISGYRDPREFPGGIVPADPLYEPPPVDEPFERLLAGAAQMRSETEQADLKIANQKLRLDLSRNRLRPRLDLVAGYQQFGLGGTEIVRDFSGGFIDPAIVRSVPGGIGDSFSQLFSGRFYGYLLGVSLELPVFNTEARASNAQAQIAFEEATLEKRSLEQAIALEVRQALNLIEMNQASLEAARAAVRFAQRRLEGETDRFAVGLGTTRELFEAQRDLLRAESVSQRAQVDLIKSHNLLEKTVGRTLERKGIHLSEALRTNVR